VDWVHLAQDNVLVEDASEHGNEPSDSINGREFLTGSATISFSRRTLL
jgi:hypothetical protein